MNWMEMSLEDFERALASKKATPGGGTAAAVALGQAGALTEMVSALTLGHDQWSDGWPSAQHAREVSALVRKRAGQLSVEDSDAFDLVVAGFRMPKGTEVEKEERRNAIRNATLRAAEVPLETAKMGMKLLSSLEDLARLGNSNAASDVGVASLLASAAVKGALFNVDINVASLPDEMGAPVANETNGMREECSTISRGIMHAVHERISE